jgi:hypothetical protein
MTGASKTGRAAPRLSALLTALACGLCTQALAGDAKRAEPQPAQVARAGADLARAQCNRLLHDDADEFAVCIEELWARAPQGALWCAEVGPPKGAARSADCARLGIAYAGWIGGITADRMGLAGAEQVAARDRPRFRALQKKLRLPDTALCGLIEGNCAAFLAILAQQERGGQ